MNTIVGKIEGAGPSSPLKLGLVDESTVEVGFSTISTLGSEVPMNVGFALGLGVEANAGCSLIK